MKKAKLIQVGLGGWGLNWAQAVVHQVESAQVVAFVDGNPSARARAEKELGVAANCFYASLDEAVEAVEADGIVAVVPAVAHKTVAEAGLRAGKHVLVEKPFTETIADALDLIELADQAKKILMVSQNYRYHAAGIAAAGLVKRRVYGRLLSATIEFRQDWKASGHRYHDITAPLLLDMGIHHFDMVRMILGEDIARVACRSWTTPYSPFRDHGAAHALLMLESGVAISYTGSWLRRGVPTPWGGQWVIDCEKGELLFAVRPAKEGVPPEAGKLFLRGMDGVVEELAIDPLRYSDRAGALDAFARAIVAKKPPQFAPTGRDNIRSLATSFACMRSAAEDGRWVALADVVP
jgi:predicted dehydrogenase